MKKSLFVAAAALAMAAQSFAAPANDATLEKYLRRAMTICPGTSFTIKPVPESLAGFNLYRVVQNSTDQNCTHSGYLAVAPKTGNTLLGDAFLLPTNGTIDARLKDLGSKLLKKPVTVTIGKEAGAEKLRPVAIITQSRYGPFEYHGYVDSSSKYFFVGRKGNLSVDPGESLLDALGISNAVNRGNSMGRVRILELSDFECPTCQRAHMMLEPFFRKNLGKIAFSRLDLSLFEHHEWSFEAAMGARAISKVAPAKYWDYVDYMFTNQEIINPSNVTQMIQSFCEDQNIDWKKIAPLYNSKTDRKALLLQISHAYDNGVLATPTYIVNGQNVFFGTDGDYLRSYLEQVVNGK